MPADNPMSADLRLRRREIDQAALTVPRARGRAGSIACSTESKRPGKSSSSSWRRKEFIQTMPRGSMRIMPASRRTRKWREAVDLLRSISISQQFILSCLAMALTIWSRVGALKAKRTLGKMIWLLAGCNGIRMESNSPKLAYFQCSLIYEQVTCRVFLTHYGGNGFHEAYQCRKMGCGSGGNFFHS